MTSSKVQQPEFFRQPQESGGWNWAREGEDA